MPTCNHCNRNGNLKLIEGICRKCYFPIARKQAELETYLMFFPVIPKNNGELLFPEQKKEIEDMVKFIRELRKERGLNETIKISISDVHPLFPSMSEETKAYYKDLTY